MLLVGLPFLLFSGRRMKYEYCCRRLWSVIVDQRGAALGGRPVFGHVVACLSFGSTSSTRFRNHPMLSLKVRQLSPMT